MATTLASRAEDILQQLPLDLDLAATDRLDQVRLSGLSDTGSMEGAGPQPRAAVLPDELGFVGGDGVVSTVTHAYAEGLVCPVEIFEQLGGFDEHFAPGYYEDADLAFRVRSIQPVLRPGTSMTSGSTGFYEAS